MRSRFTGLGSYRLRVPCAVVFALAILGCAVSETRPRTSDTLADSASATGYALSALKQMTDFLAVLPHFGFEAEVSFDVMQPGGHKLEFGSTREFRLRRPDRATLAVLHREGGEEFLYFDGHSLVAFIPSRNAYALREIPGTAGAALDFLVQELGVPAPLGDLLHPDLYTDMLDRIESGSWVGEEWLDGFPCDHFLFQTPDADIQLWIERSDRPFPRRLVISYFKSQGTPQFRARLHDWDIETEEPDAVFFFAPAATAERVSFSKLFEFSGALGDGDLR